MIKVTIYQRSNLIWGFEINGHANAGRYGHDIVCAAVSVLSITTVNGIVATVKIHPQIKSDPVNGGFLSIRIPDSLNSRQRLQVQTLLKSFVLGIKAISKQYANHVEVKINENGGV